MSNITTLTTASTPSELAEYADGINNLVAMAEDYARDALDFALRVGERLTEAKTHVAYGEWRQWITDNLTIAPRTAQAYMRLHAKHSQLTIEEAQRVAHLPVRQAIAAMTTPASAPPKSPDMGSTRRSQREAWAKRLRASQKMHSTLVDQVRSGSIKRGDIDRYRELCRTTLAVLDEIEANANDGDCVSHDTQEAPHADVA